MSFIRTRAPAAAVAVAVGGLLVGCAAPVATPGSPLVGLHACPGAGTVIGVFSASAAPRSTTDGPRLGTDTWALNLDGSARRLTDDGVHLGAVIGPDSRSAYTLRSSGRVLGEALETPGTIERLDLITGDRATIATLPGIVDLAVSADGQHLAAAHTVASDPGAGPGVNTVTVLDLTTLRPETTLSRPRDVPADVFSAVTQVALDADGGRVAYAVAVEVRRGVVVNTLRIRDVASDTDTTVYRAEGTDFVSDVAWSADGATVVAAIRHQEPTDSAEDPARFRTLFVDVASGRTTTDVGFAQDISPVSRNGRRVLGIAPAAGAGGDPHGRALVAWEHGARPSRPAPTESQGAGPSVAECSYR